MTKNRLILIISTCILLISVIFALKQHQENNLYERFISNELRKSFSEFVAAILQNDEILNPYMTNGKEKKLPEQASHLCFNFKTIGKEYGNMLTVARDLKKFNNVKHNDTTALVSEGIHYFLARSVIGNGLLGDCSEAKSIIVLDQAHIEKLSEIQHITAHWTEIVKKHVPAVTTTEVDDIDWSMFVNDAMWVLILEELSEYANDSGMTGMSQFFN